MIIRLKNNFEENKEIVMSLPHPRVLVNACTHGDEKIGILIQNLLNKLEIKNGSLIFNVANQEAFKRNIRYIEIDLNRSFPGKEDGFFEERIAYGITPVLKEIDFVIDIHSTESGLEDAIIIEFFNQKIKEIINIIKPKYVLLFSLDKKNSLLSVCKNGIAFEYGKDKDKEKGNEIFLGILKILGYFNMVDINNTIKRELKQVARFIEIYGKVEKPQNALINLSIKNYSLVKKGECIGYTYDNQKILADEDFIPILFGKNTYKDIFGFKGRFILK